MIQKPKRLIIFWVLLTIVVSFLVQVSLYATMQCHTEVLWQATLHIKSNLDALVWHSARGYMQGLPELASQGTMPCRQHSPEFVVAFTPFIFCSGSWPENIISEPFHLPRTRKLTLSFDGTPSTLQKCRASCVSWRYLQHLATFKTAHSDPDKKLLPTEGVK